MIRKATLEDYKIVAHLAHELWNDSKLKELENEFQDYLSSDDIAIYIAYEDTIPIAFAECSLRHDYVEGTNTTPVAYLEGIYVKEEYRLRKFASNLIEYCQNWAREKGCLEFASDCELENKTSLEFHKKIGFQEVNRIICFTKELER